MNGTSLTNLHSLWDSGMITVRLRRDFHSNTSLYYDHIYELMRNLTSVNDDDNTEQWVNENINFVCSQIYVDEHNITMNATANFTLGEIYYQKSIPVIERRLAQGGRRLGALLNKLAKNRPHKPSDEICYGYIVLAAVLGAELIIAIVVGITIWYRCKDKSSSVISFAFTSRKESN
jgi:hypothetical protein